MFTVSEKLSGQFIINMTKKALVYGWYNQGNIGDQLFISAFKHLFPDFDLYFTEILTLDKLNRASIVIFGGGSFLFGPPRAENGALELLDSKLIYYIGVGVEAIVHPIHEQLIKQAKLVAIRTPSELNRIKSWNNNTIVIPDLVFSLQDKIKKSKKIPKSILILPNIAVVPSHNDPYWKHSSWSYFKSEFCQFLDEIIAQGFNIQFLSMCSNTEMDDHWAACEIISHMQRRSNYPIIDNVPSNLEQLSRLLSQYEYIITQRFHGIVLSEMIGAPYISLYHHDKLKNDKPNYLSYYGLTKSKLLHQFNNIQSMNCSPIMPIETNIFEELKCLFGGSQSEE